MFDAKFGEGTWAEFTKASFEEQNLRQIVAKTFNDAMQNCIKVFQKLPQDVRDSVADHLRENHYFLAYKTIQVKFLYGYVNVKEVKSVLNLLLLAGALMMAESLFPVTIDSTCSGGERARWCSTSRSRRATETSLSVSRRLLPGN